MTANLEHLKVQNGDPVAARDIPAALTAGLLSFDDGAWQTFDANGETTYHDRSGTTRGEWRAEGDGRFSSFWPPSYTGHYDLRWVVEDGGIVGLSFTSHDTRLQSVGRYASAT